MKLLIFSAFESDACNSLNSLQLLVNLYLIL